MSKSHFNAPHFKDPEAARTYLEALRWGKERVCPHCGTVNHSFATKKRGLYPIQGLPTERPVLIFALFLGFVVACVNVGLNQIAPAGSWGY